jgi:hypothetical protein
MEKKCFNVDWERVYSAGCEILNRIYAYLLSEFVQRKTTFFFHSRCRQIILPRHAGSELATAQYSRARHRFALHRYAAMLALREAQIFQASTPLNIFNTIVAGNTVSDVATMVMEERQRPNTAHWRTALSASRQNYVDGAVDRSGSVLSSDGGQTPTKLGSKVRPILYHWLRTVRY